MAKRKQTDTVFDVLHVHVDQAFGLAHPEKSRRFETRRSVRKVSSRSTLDWLALLEKLAETLAAHGKGRTSRSDENWRVELKDDESGQNRGEKKLEKMLAKMFRREKAWEWANQVPICSGVFDGSHGKRSVDLVRHDAEQIELIELKTDSNTPLHAAIEILIYGLVYRYSRLNAATLGYGRSTGSRVVGALVTGPAALAKKVKLKVLAPAPYYDRDREHVLSVQRRLDEALIELGKKHGDDFSLSFSFESIPASISKEEREACSDEVLWRIVEERVALG